MVERRPVKPEDGGSKPSAFARPLKFVLTKECNCLECYLSKVVWGPVIAEQALAIDKMIMEGDKDNGKSRAVCSPRNIGQG